MNAATSFPVRYTVPGLRRVSVPAAIAGVPGKVGPIEFRFPTNREVTDLLVLPEDGAPESLAGLSLEILDADDENAFSDLIGDPRATSTPYAVPCLSMVGRGFDPFPFQRFVKHGDRWFLTLKNLGAAPVRVACVLIGVREVP